MFYGEFGYRIDEKGRVPIPPRFRAELKRDGMVLTTGIEKCVAIYPLAEWKKLASSLTTGPIAPSKLRSLHRAIFATAFTAEMDGQGRIAIPYPLRQYAGIKDDVAVVGVNTNLELWNQQEWEAEKARSQQEVWRNIESLEKR